jgi:hypothetical protein
VTPSAGTRAVTASSLTHALPNDPHLTELLKTILLDKSQLADLGETALNFFDFRELICELLKI